MFRKNTAGQFIHFQGVDATTGGIKSGVTWTVRRCLDGTFAAATGTVTEDGTTGWYKFAMSQADTNGNNGGFNFTGTGAVPQTVNIVTTAADPTDSVRFGLTALPNAAAEAAGGLYTRGTGAGQIAQDANGNVRVNVDTIKTNPVVNAGTITFPTTATLASTTNITAGTIATVTNLTNAPTAGDFTATMKTSIGTAVAASAVASVTGNVGGNVAGTVAGVTPSVAGDAMALTSAERNSTADALLNRDMSTGMDSGSPTVRTMRQALRFLRNKWSISGTTLTVTKEDDTTSSWTGTVTATAGADPITGNDPA